MKKSMFVLPLALAISGALPHAAKAEMICDAALTSAELLPYRTNEPCGSKTGNYLQRTVCNSDDCYTNAISLPVGRTAGCFRIVALNGRPDWKIVNTSTGAVVFDPVMPLRAPRLSGITLSAGTYHIVLDRTKSSKDAWITLGFVDYP